MKNQFLEFYRGHNISPVRQDIEDYQLFIKKRKKLYRQMGMPVVAFNGAKMLEVGSGSGYNTLAFFEWGANVDIVEPNETGVKEMEELFSKMQIKKERYTISNVMLEEFNCKEQYDIVVAEGFIPGLDNKDEVLQCLSKFVRKDGVLIVTCMDEVGMFVEQLKRLVGFIITKDIKEYSEKVSVLTSIFEPYLKKLDGMNRKVEDWVQDQLLNPAIQTQRFSLGDAIHYFNEKFDILGTVPQMFTDYSWYKDIKFDYKMDYLVQFNQKQNNLLNATNVNENIIKEDEGTLLRKQLTNIKNYEVLYEIKPKAEYIDAIIQELNLAKTCIVNCDEKIGLFVEEIIAILTGEVSLESINEMASFCELFGKGQQYISVVKV